MGGKKDLNYRYGYEFPDGGKIEVNVNIDGQSLGLIEEAKRDRYPEWTELGYKRCPNCSLDPEKNKYCPVAKNLSSIIEYFADCNSYDVVTLSIRNEAREYSKKTAIAEGVSSLAGIYMVTSGCPILDRLRPMVRFHLPFATIEETKYRAVTMYLMAQYMLYRAGKTPDWDLKNLQKLYSDVRMVNRHFADRLNNIKIKDASINAIIKLDCFAGDISLSLEVRDIFKEMKGIFGAFLEND
ncbi:MAG: hypothetical protein JW803_06080 [Endomicrobiales bacterium]|nr:hypothetical protein [Endomicrobiales bacterium]